MDQSVRILITDDQPPTREGLKALLNLMSQIEVIGEAANGQEALNLVEQHHPNVVLMDMQMPVMDGLQATRLIKIRWPEIKVIALTIHPTYRTAAFKAGVDAFLLKGCPLDLLQTTILETGKLGTLSSIEQEKKLDDHQKSDGA
jgi:DNA-binding NarL/FixJ family response regulator